MEIRTRGRRVTLIVEEVSGSPIHEYVAHLLDGAEPLEVSLHLTQLPGPGPIGVRELWARGARLELRVAGDIIDVSQRVRPAASAAAFTCPRCELTSHHPTDAAEGYCGACHDWTGIAQAAMTEVRTQYGVDLPRPNSDERTIDFVRDDRRSAHTHTRTVMITTYPDGTVVTVTAPWKRISEISDVPAPGSAAAAGS